MKHIVDSRGSIAPLGIGLFLFSTVLLMVVSSATSLFIFQKRLTNLAESASLFVAQTNSSAADYLRLTRKVESQDMLITNRTLEDGVTVEVIVCEQWSPLFQTYLEFAGSKVCAHASARAE